MRNIIIVFLLILSLYSDDEYQLGEGIQVSSSPLPLYLGGYFSIDYKSMDEADRYRIDDLAFMGYGAYKNFSYIAEVEFKEFYVQNRVENNTVITRDQHLYIERLYVDYNFNENYLVRVGKFNSAVGYWNLLPINVLRETTSSPVSTEILFPKFTTGIGASHTSYTDNEIKIDLMLQNNSDVDDEYNNYKIDRHYGLGISYAKDDLTYKVNVGFFHKVIDHNIYPDNLYYLLLSTKYEKDNYQFLAELGSQMSYYKFTTSYAGYIQGLYRFTQKHIGVIRLESYDDIARDTSDQMAIFAYTYRPLYPVALKGEYQLHSHSEKNQFLFSFSVLF